MPFTASHAVVALPFVRTPLLPAAIAVGAMTPDLPLFVRGTPLTYQLTHTNVLATAIVAFALLVLWYLVLRPAVREVAPLWLARRLPPEWDLTGQSAWRSVRDSSPRGRGVIVWGVLVAISLMIGVTSHIVWDAFTHEDRWGLDVIPALTEQWGPLPGFKWLQYASTALGLIILAVFAARWLTRRTAGTIQRLLPALVRWSWWLSLPLILTIAWLWGLAVLGPIQGTFTIPHLAYRVLPPACAVWGALTVALCLAVMLLRRSRSRSHATP